ncbi:MAG TPA: hypothetical protein VN238_18380, partial [Solirubrobacteraceae bacterium]|nr:hypothetical protein [Solirubrobacteraceae bacterium]
GPLSAAQFATMNAGALEMRGGPGATESAALAAGATLHVRRDAADTLLELVWTPTANCWWRVDGSMIARETLGAWGRADVCVELLGATDSRGGGFARGPVELMRSSNGQGGGSWDTGRPSALYRLSAGVQATARLRLTVISSTWVYYRDASYQSLSAHVVGFW